MPGAISRTTGSATRWNSLTLSFMRQGSVQPLSVTTGLYGRPLGGINGAIVAGDDCVAASGSEAAPARVTAVAPTMAAPARKVRRDVSGGVTVFLWRSVARGHRARCRDGI